MELSKNKLKYFSQFAKKKNRDEAGLFLVEGNKMVEELLSSSFTTNCIVATKEWLQVHQPQCKFYEASSDDIAHISVLQHPQDAWALAEQKKNDEIFNVQKGLTIALDDIQDPGNMGTIIRLADWFGVSQIICSENCVDVYNPKVVQATMGSIFRMNIHYTNLVTFLQQQTDTQIFIADMDGENVYTSPLPHDAIIVMGNEGNGVSDEVTHCANHVIQIPSFNTTGKTSESLNVAIATAILCSEFQRRTL